MLELCSFGSLSDIIRGYGFDWSSKKSPPLSLSMIDKTFLALGCAQGLAAVHAYQGDMCHRDVKSFNFLVDSQLNAKIADLELGAANSTADVTTKEPLAIEEMLANWLAPEVIIEGKYQQPSDVYSLSIVLWEIISGGLPFDGYSQPEIRDLVSKPCLIEILSFKYFIISYVHI